MGEKVRIAVLGGDGIGPEVMAEALKVLHVLEKVLHLEFEPKQFDSGWRYFSKKGILWEDGTLEACRDWADVVLHGATGWPGARPKGWSPADGSVVLDLRYELDLYANVRPVRPILGVPTMMCGKETWFWSDKGIDLTIVRENLEGLYLGARSTPYPDLDMEVQIDQRPVSRKGTRRIMNFAFEEALRRGKKGGASLTCVDKSNAFAACALFKQVFDDRSASYKDVRTSHFYADAFQLALLKDPARFDVVVTPNFIGDMVTDLAAILQGGLGMAPSGNIGDDGAMFEPVHGSGPDIAGKGVANPTGMILSTAMMLQWLGRCRKDDIFTRAARMLEDAVEQHYRTTKIWTPDLGGTYSTIDVGNSIGSIIKDLGRKGP